MAKTVFEDGDISLKIPGTRLLAAWLNKVFLHRHTGLDADGSAPLDFAVDSGAADALVAALTPPLTALIVGMPINIQVAATNTGAATLNLDGLGVKAIKKLGGTALAAGDLQTDQIVTVAYDGVAFQLLSYNSPPVTDAATLQGQSAAMLCPPGLVANFGAATVPDGWLLCDGRQVLRAQYAVLFAYIGTTWGAGDNVSTFNLPDSRAEFARGADAGRGIDPDLTVGSWFADEVRAHTHSLNNAVTASVSGAVDGDSGTSGTFNATGSTGGSETRPRANTYLTCIKY